MATKKVTGVKTPSCISVIGLGKLGFSMVVAFAKRGFRVVGMDVNEEFVRKVNAGIAPIIETDVQELLDRNRARIRATTDIAEAVRASDLTCIIVATPSQPDGAFSNAQLLPAIEKVGRALRGKKGFHVVAVTCTVMPGTTDTIVRPLIEKASGKKCGRDFGLVYNPEFIALGSVVRDFLNPDFLLLGETDAKTGMVMERLYRKACENDAPMAHMKPVEAEIAKISLNCFCTTKIAFANMLAELAEKIPGADARVITQAIGLDKRIGRKYIDPGLGFGGPCFPRDNVAFRRFASQLGVAVPIPEAVHTSNRSQAGRVVARVGRMLPHGRVAVLGLSYKPETPVVEESQAVEIAQALVSDGKYRVTVYDPLAMHNARKVLGSSVSYADSTAECLKGAELCILAMPWREFRGLKAATIRRLMKKPRVLDCWRCIDPAEAARLEYVSVGMGSR